MFRHSAKGKVVAWDVRSYHVFVKVWIFIGFAIEISNLTLPLPFVYSLSDYCILQEVCLLYVQQIH